MVSEVAVEAAPEVDLAIPETATENPDPVEEPEVAAPEVEEAAAEAEPEPIVPVEEERRYTEAELREQRRIAQQEALEYDRRQRQAEGARRAAEARREQQEQAELRDVVEVAIHRGDDADAINNLLTRYTEKRAGQHVERAISSMDVAAQYLTQPLLGGEPVELDERSTQIALRLQDRFHAVYSKGLEDGKSVLAGDTIPKADLKKYVDAEIARINKAKNQDKKPLERPAEGQVSTSNVMTWGQYMALSEAEQLAMPEKERNAIMAADRKARLGG